LPTQRRREKAATGALGSSQGAERADKGATSALDGVARALPALLRAEKLQKRAALSGIRLARHPGPADKLAEEISRTRRSFSG
jgi:ATP diphosphatase